MTQMQKRIPVTVVFHLYREVPEDWDDHLIHFHLEENHCIDNFVNDMTRDIEANPGYCQSCNRAETIVGHIPFKDIQALASPLPTDGDPR